MENAKNNLVGSTFWLHSGIFWSIAHILPYNPMHLCQLKVGMEKKHNTKQFILKYYIKIQKNTNNYLHT